jgi:hypothetical protein
MQACVSDVSVYVSSYGRHEVPARGNNQEQMWKSVSITIPNEPPTTIIEQHSLMALSKPTKQNKIRLLTVKGQEGK